MCQPFFDAVREIEEQVMRSQHLLLCLDYDGTLTHFTATPLGAHLSPHMERILLSLGEHDHATVAIVSGRDRADLSGRVGIPGLVYAGNHGLEIGGPGFLFVEPTAAAQVGPLQELAERLAAALQDVQGALVEYKGLTLSVHFRQVAAGDLDKVGGAVQQALAGATQPFILTTGEKVYEIRPKVTWNKGSAVAWIKEKMARPDTLAIYVGDDTTDEDAFKAMPDGITIRVGHPPATAAHYSLEGPSEVRKLLEWIDDVLRHKALRDAEATHAAGQEALV